MIEGKTSRGFNYTIDPKKFHSMKTVRKLSKMTEESPPGEVIDVMEMILGTEQLEALIMHCDEKATDEEFGDKIFTLEIGEIISKAGEVSEIKK